MSRNHTCIWDAYANRVAGPRNWQTETHSGHCCSTHQFQSYMTSIKTLWLEETSILFCMSAVPIQQTVKCKTPIISTEIACMPHLPWRGCYTVRKDTILVNATFSRHISFLISYRMRLWQGFSTWGSVDLRFLWPLSLLGTVLYAVTSAL